MKAPGAKGAKTISLKDYYTGCDCGQCNTEIKLAGGDSFFNESFVEKVFKGLLKPNQIELEYYFQVAGNLSKALMKGMGISKPNVMDSRTGLTERLKNNLFAFSGAKSLTILQEYNKQLVDEDGEPKSYSKFRADVNPIDIEFNDVYLHTEYNSAMSMAQMADKWDSLKQYDMLEYRTVGDNKVREAHRKLDGITLPPSDPLWAKIYPPNDWNCRCTVIPAPGAKEVGRDKAKAVVNMKPSDGGIKPYFKRNVGTEKVLFNDSHPYFQRTKVDFDKNKEHQFMAEENYGMRPAEKIVQDDLTELQETKTIEQAKQIWDSTDKHITTIDGLEWDMNDNWTHIVNQNHEDRWKYIHVAKDILENADEVWSTRELENNKTVFYKRYIKYYKGQPVVFSHDIDNPNGWTMYSAHKDKDGKFSKLRANARKGVLIHRK